VDRLQFTERDVSALMGAHVLGRASLANSGYDGSWVPADQNSRFTNLYFRDLLGRRWNRQRLPDFEGMPRAQWSGPRNTMMLNTDIHLAFSPSGRCNGAGGNGNCPRAQHGFSEAVTEFARSQLAFFDAFQSAWPKMSALGAGSLACPLDDCSTPGPFGSPTPPEMQPNGQGPPPRGQRPPPQTRQGQGPAPRDQQPATQGDQGEPQTPRGQRSAPGQRPAPRGR